MSPTGGETATVSLYGIKKIFALGRQAVSPQIAHTEKDYRFYCLGRLHKLTVIIMGKAS